MNPLSPPLGFPLLVVPDEHGRLHWPSLERSVQDTVRAVLATTPGEQLMRPDFGAGVESLLHEPDTLATRRRLRDTVQDALRRWEPRAVLDALHIADVPGEPGHLRVDLQWRLVRNGVPGRLTFSLNRDR